LALPGLDLESGIDAHFDIRAVNGKCRTTHRSHQLRMLMIDCVNEVLFSMAFEFA